MEFELIWLLVLPLFFGLGWLAARHESRGASRARDLPDAYFRGLNFLLNEQPDRAIDEFIDVVRLDPETVELHFALGNLFRRRGETDRAIRVHQNLIDRGGLDLDTRHHAVFELGEDFLKAGLLDRAEQAFMQLEETPWSHQALQHRLAIAQLVRDWPQAIALASRLTSGDPSRQTVSALAHFHCELAARALAGKSSDRFEQVRRHLDDAAAVSSSHPRIALMRGELAMAQGQPQAALAVWNGLRLEQPGWFALGARDWISAHAALGLLDEGIATIEAQLESQRSTDLFLAVLEARADRDGEARAIEWARAALKRTPSLLGLERLLELRLRHPEGLEHRDELELMRSLLRGQAQRLSRFVCAHCGFKARQYYWQCPGCSLWDSCAPQRAEELERT